MIRMQHINHWTERARATSAAKADAPGRPRRSVLSFPKCVNTLARSRQVLIAVGSLLLSACATKSRGPAVVPASDLPADVAMSQGAGQGMLLFVKVRLDSGQELPFAVDTGSPYTSVPSSLASKLGERLGSRRFSTLDSRDEVEHFYAAPKLFLGKTQLVSGPQIGASGMFGVLGMDCLRHYCIQLDFKAKTVRFLSSAHVKTADLGKPFSLTKSRYAMIKHAAFFQTKETDLLVDTGCPFDGYLNSGAFKRAARQRQAQSLPLLKDGAVRGVAPGYALFSECVWDGETYTNLIIGKGVDLIGLKFLARHRVTFDFPNGVIYLELAASDALANACSP